MADFPFFKMASVRLDFQKLQILTPGPVPKHNVRHCSKFHEDGSNRSGDMADFRFFDMAAVRHLGFVLRVCKPPTKSIWRSLLVCKIWL